MWGYGLDVGVQAVCGGTGCMGSIVQERVVLQGAPRLSQRVGSAVGPVLAHPLPPYSWQVPAGTLTPAQLASLTHISTIGCSLSAAATLCTLLLCCFSR